MARVRERVIQILDSLPEDATLNDVMAALCLEAKTEESLGDLDEASEIAQEEIQRRMARWFGQ